MTHWHPIETAPYNQEVRVRVGRRKFLAILIPDGSMTEDEKPCDQWQATTDDHPRCWSDGACWESNADERMSAQPTHWQAISFEPADVDLHSVSQAEAEARGWA